MPQAPEILQIDSIAKIEEPQKRSAKEVWGTITNFENLLERFVFYNPVAHYLIGDVGKTRLATDLVSYSLARIAQEHPLVITDLPRTVFTVAPDVLVPQEIKQMRYTLYAVQREVWEEAMETLPRLVVFDAAARRFCMLPMREWKIRNPIGKNENFEIPVWFFSCFGNRETYFFTPSQVSGSEQLSVPVLRDGMPLAEIVGFAEEFFQVHGVPREKQVLDAHDNMTHLFNDSLKQVKPIAEKDIIKKDLSCDPEYRREIDELIRFYRSVFPGSE